MEKYLVPKQLQKECKTHDVDTVSSVKTSTNVVVDKNIRNDRVINDEYLQKCYTIEEHMSMGDYDEFESVNNGRFGKKLLVKNVVL